MKLREKLAFRLFCFGILGSVVILADQKPSSNWYYDHWCGGSLQYLDDKYCSKQFPAYFDHQLSRDWQCDVPVKLKPTINYESEKDLPSVSVDIDALLEYVYDP